MRLVNHSFKPGIWVVSPGLWSEIDSLLIRSSDSSMSVNSHPQQVLVIGSGAREHALVWRLSLSPQVARICVAPGNGGTHALASSSKVPIHHASVSSNRDICAYALEQKIGTPLFFKTKMTSLSDPVLAFS